MNDLELTLANIDRLIKEASRGDLTFAEKAALFAAMDVIARDVDKHINEDCGGDRNALGKVVEFRWHVAAALGFDVTNGHSVSQHTSWAYGAWNTLCHELRRHKARREKQGEA